MKPLRFDARSREQWQRFCEQATDEQLLATLIETEDQINPHVASRDIDREFYRECAALLKKELHRRQGPYKELIK